MSDSAIVGVGGPTDTKDVPFDDLNETDKLYRTASEKLEHFAQHPDTDASIRSAMESLDALFMHIRKLKEESRQKVKEAEPLVPADPGHGGPACSVFFIVSSKKQPNICIIYEAVTDNICYNTTQLHNSSLRLELSEPCEEDQ